MQPGQDDTVNEDDPGPAGSGHPWPHRARLAIAQFRPDWATMRQRLPDTLRSYVRLDLRYSFLVIAGLVLVGAVVQVFMPHGWTVWPVVFAGGLLSMIDEAADRNGVGVPPLRVIAFVAGVLLAWLALAMTMKLVNPIVPILGGSVAAYYGIRGGLKRRAARALMDERVSNGQCAHCGEPVEEGVIDCPHCGELTNPEGVRSRWATRIAMSPASVARSRAALRPEAGATTARRKEQALLDKRYRPRAPKR